MSRSARNRLARKPVNRTIVNPSHNRPATAGTNPALRIPDPIGVTGPGPRKGSVRYSGSGDHSGSAYTSEWTRSPYYFTDPRWSATVSG